MSTATRDIARDIAERTGRLTDEVTRPLPGSKRVYVAGSRGAVQVPMREISQAQTPATFGVEKNPPITVYDTSGPYTDPDKAIDLTSGLSALRADWIVERKDTEQLTGLSSE